MKKVLIGLMLLCWNGLASADNSVLVSVSDGAPGDTVTVQVSISASDRIVAAEFSIPIAEGISYVNGSFNALITGMNCSSALKEDVLKAYFYNTSLDDSKIENGVLFSYKVVLGVLPGVFRVQPEVLLSDVDGKPLNVKVAGSSIMVKAPQMALSTEIVDFGHIAIRSSYSRTIDITNTGTTPLNVFSINSSSQELVVSEPTFVVQPGASKQLDIIYSPLLPEAQEMILTIESDAVVDSKCTVSVISDTYSVNELEVSNIIGESDSVISVCLMMDNMEDIAALQCSFHLPEGIEYIDGSIALSDRLKDMSSFIAVNNGILNLYVYSESDALIGEGSGTIVSFDLLLGTENGIYDLVPENVILGNRAFSNVLSGVSAGSIEIMSPLVECDTVFNIGSIPLTEAVSGAFEIKNNGKKDLIIEQVVFDDSLFYLNDPCPIIISPGSKKDLKVCSKIDYPVDYSSNMRLFTNAPNNRIIDVDIVGGTYEPNFLTSQVKVNQDGTGSVTIGLSNYGNVMAIQMNIYGLEDMVVDNSSFALTDRCTNLSSLLTTNDDGGVKVLIYTLSDSIISGDNGDLFTFTFSGKGMIGDNLTVRIADIIISNEKGINIASVNDLTVNAIVTATLPIVQDICDENIYDLTGRRIMVDDLSAVPAGIYIRNGRKLIIR